MRGQKCFGIGVRWSLHVVMQITIAQVAIVDQPHTGKRGLQRGIGLAHEVGNARYGNANVVLDVQALLGLRQRDALADMP